MRRSLLLLVVECGWEVLLCKDEDVRVRVECTQLACSLLERWDLLQQDMKFFLF
jgi:hypothetical protein